MVSALAAEARTLGGPARRRAGNGVIPEGIAQWSDGSLVAVCGVGCRAAGAAAESLAAAGATALVSWGLAGGLDPALSAGSICLPDRVTRRGGEIFSVNSRLREIVMGAIEAQGADAIKTLGAGAARYRLMGATRRRVAGGTLLTSEMAIASVADKAAAFRATGAVAVDMESAAVALIAATRRLPFVAVRVIVDTNEDALPAAVVAAGGDGELKLSRLLLGLMRAPQDLGAVVRLARRYRTALAVLTAVGRSGALAHLGNAIDAATPRT